MGGTHDAENGSRQGIVVVDGDVRESGWQRLDLDAILLPLKREASRRVPLSAFVSIGLRGRGPVPGFPARSEVARFANDNHAISGDRRAVWRDLVFLLILAATVVGAFWSGRMQGYQKVIVVPGPSSFHSVVT